jgi:hypothetical protein
LKTSNDRNNRKLGGQESKISLDEEEENDKDFEMNMEQLMSKFSLENVFKKADTNDDEDKEPEQKQE